MADAKPGTVVARGDVKVDGKPVQHTTNIFPGEKMEAGSDGAASITSIGSVAGVRGSAKLIYGDNSIDLECGQVQVATINQFEVRAHGVSVKPVNATRTEMAAQQHNKSVRVSAIEAPIAVTQGQTNVVLNPGESKDFSDGAHCLDAVPDWMPPFIWAGTWIPFSPDSDHDLDDISPSEP